MWYVVVSDDSDDSDGDIVQGKFGPFQPNRECRVPIWMAHALWKRKKCSIVAPEWMKPEYLQGAGMWGEATGERCSVVECHRGNLYWRASGDEMTSFVFCMKMWMVVAMSC